MITLSEGIKRQKMRGMVDFREDTDLKFARHSTKGPAKKLLFRFLILVSFTVFASEPAPAQTQTADKAGVLRDVAAKWIAVGTEQYNRSQYIRAEQSLLYAMDYRKHLTKKELAELERLLSSVREALLQRQSIQKAIEAAGQLIEGGSLFQAKARLENLLTQSPVSPQQRKRIEKSLNKIEVKLQLYVKQMDEIYKNVITSYLNGRLDKARQKLLKIDSILAQIKTDGTIEESQASQAPAPKPAEIPAKQQTKGQVIQIQEETQRHQTKDKAAVLEDKTEKPGPDAAEPQTKRPHHEEKPLSRKEKIVRGYTRAVVNDASEKAKNLIKRKNLQDALKVIRQAEQIINQNRQYLDDEIYNQYNLRLNDLAGQITSKTSR